MAGFSHCELFHPTNDRLQSKSVGGIGKLNLVKELLAQKKFYVMADFN
jgi:hypothetical protein